MAGCHGLGFIAWVSVFIPFPYAARLHLSSLLLEAASAFRVRGMHRDAADIHPASSQTARFQAGAPHTFHAVYATGPFHCLPLLQPREVEGKNLSLQKQRGNTFLKILRIFTSMNWIPHPLVLQGQIVDLLPLEEKHFSTLHDLARDKRIWDFFPLDGSDPAILQKTLHDALRERDNDVHYPFVIFHKEEQRIIGSTRYMEMQPWNKKAEIGWTWLDPSLWATAANTEIKLLMLTYAFEQMGACRVEFRTDVLNLRSRKAIEKLGAQFEGVLRNHMIRSNGTKRDSAYFSILDTEWDVVKKHLAATLSEKLSQGGEGR
jgi:RimJ/RimL family protein N-acetyltransferase